MRAVLFSLLLLLGGCPSFTRPAVSPDDGEETLRASIRSTVAIVRLGDPFCAGVFVGESTVLTAAHCVTDEPVVDVGLHADEISGLWMTDYPFHVVHVDETQDLAVLSAGAILPVHPYVLLSPEEPDVGDLVVAIGHPYGLTYTVTTGIVSHSVREAEWDDVEGTQYWLQISAPLAPGNSGGPIFNYYGELIGIASFRYEAHLSGAVPLSEIRDALE